MPARMATARVATMASLEHGLFPAQGLELAVFG
jgi:hypothetical protein